MVQREIQLPKDPLVNGQAIEVFLYKDATECPICFIYYPPYLNKTRCCDQAICSECFVQIKRADPHPPEHADPSNPAPPSEATVDPESLVTEPATCPYCQQTEFGVTFEPPPFRRGLAYSNSSGVIGTFSSAMSSSSSLNSGASPLAFGTTTHTHKRRTTSISANASNVVTTDRVRPDWATKLASARSHLARRSAAATALHTAAYLIGNGANEQRSFGFTGRSRFGRHRGESTPASGAVTPVTGEASRGTLEQAGESRREGGPRRRSRMDDLEEMMMMEAIRLSLAAEEDRKRKTEKDAAKDAKKRAKEEKKREKSNKRVYGSGASSASASALSLSLPGIGRRRGNSGASNLQQQVTPEAAEPSSSKGKAVDRGLGASTPIDFSRSGTPNQGFPGARHLDTATFGTISDNSLPAPSPTAPDKPSHLRQMSTASSAASSYVDSNAGSLRNEFHTHGTSSTTGTPNASGTHIEGAAGTSNAGKAPSSPESMFNFHSLVERIGRDDSEDKEDVARHIEYLGGDNAASSTKQDSTESNLEESIATLKVRDTPSQSQSIPMPSAGLVPEPQITPEVTITPETPAALSHGEEEGKQLGSGWSTGASREITQ